MYDLKAEALLPPFFCALKLAKLPLMPVHLNIMNTHISF